MNQHQSALDLIQTLQSSLLSERMNRPDCWIFERAVAHIALCSEHPVETLQSIRDRDSFGLNDIAGTHLRNAAERLIDLLHVTDLAQLESEFVDHSQREGFFEVTSVSRDDLEEAGFDATNVDDATMKRLVSKMADAYCDNSFWTDLPIIAEHLDIPKRPES